MMPLVIDCSPICYKAFAMMGEDFSYEDEQTGVIFSFLMQVFKIANTFHSKELVFCWDSNSYKRKDIYPEYKENRKGAMAPFQYKVVKKQMLELRCKILPKLGFKNNFIEKGFEADDIIAAIVRRNPGVTVVGSDNDLWQLLGDCVIYQQERKHRFTKEEFIELHGVEPDEWAEVKNISGCSGDNVKGIEGVGWKKAIQYLNGTLPNGKIKDRINSRESRKIIVRNDALIRLPFVGLKFDGTIKETTCSDIGIWIDVFTDYNFKSFLAKNYLDTIKSVFQNKTLQ